MRAAALAGLFFGAAAMASAFDWGGSLEDNSWSVIPTIDPGTSTFYQTETARAWTSYQFGREASFLLKGSLSNTSAWDLGKHTATNTVAVDLDSAVYSGNGLVAGRSTFQDFGGTVLNTELDAVQYSFSVPGIDFSALLGTAALIFKDQSTIVVSQADLNDRVIAQNWTKPSTLFAPPRAVAYFESDFTSIVPEQTLKVSEIVQYDYRWYNVAKLGGDHDPTNNNGPSAPVSIAYTGFGGSGRLWSSLYWDAWAYAGYGISMTPVGTYTPARVSPPASPAVFPKWTQSYILNGIGNINLTWLLPQINYTIINLGIQAGSWDYDGISPDQNLATGSKPHLFTGYFGVSRTGSSLIFNPQPTNVVITQLLYSVKPFSGTSGGWASVQTTLSELVFVRPTPYGITESGLISTSKDLYLGAETDANVLFRPASDWGGNLGLGLFFPNKNALSRGLEIKLQLGANLSV